MKNIIIDKDNKRRQKIHKVVKSAKELVDKTTKEINKAIKSI